MFQSLLDKYKGLGSASRLGRGSFNVLRPPTRTAPRGHGEGERPWRQAWLNDRPGENLNRVGSQFGKPDIMWYTGFCKD